MSLRRGLNSDIVSMNLGNCASTTDRRTDEEMSFVGGWL